MPCNASPSNPGTSLCLWDSLNSSLATKFVVLMIPMSYFKLVFIFLSKILSFLFSSKVGLNFRLSFVRVFVLKLAIR